MSSTKRGKARVRDDNYPTPGYAVRRLLEVVDLPGGTWLDPCAGEGALLRELGVTRHDVLLSAVEIRPECRMRLEALAEPVVITDFLADPGCVPDVDVIFTNPPYLLAIQFIEACVMKATKVVMLLRLNFFGSEERASLLRGFSPDVYVLPNRPAFARNKYGKRATDSVEYAWFVFSREPRHFGRIQMLGSTPISERKRDYADLDELLGVVEKLALPKPRKPRAPAKPRGKQVPKVMLGDDVGLVTGLAGQLESPAPVHQVDIPVEPVAESKRPGDREP